MDSHNVATHLILFRVDLFQYQPYCFSSTKLFSTYTCGVYLFTDNTDDITYKLSFESFPDVHKPARRDVSINAHAPHYDNLYLRNMILSLTYMHQPGK